MILVTLTTPGEEARGEGLLYVGNHPGDELDVLVVDHLYPFLIDLLMAEWVAKSTAKSRGNRPPFWWKTFKKNTWGTVAQSKWKYWCEPPLSSAAVWRTNPLFFFGNITPKEGLNSRKFFLDFNSDWLDTFKEKLRFVDVYFVYMTNRIFAWAFVPWLEIIGKTSAQLFCTISFLQKHVSHMWNSCIIQAELIICIFSAQWLSD